MKIPDKVYDILKWVVMIVLPALATFYTAIALIWGLPYAEAIPATITALAAFLGALIGVSTKAYNKAKEAENE